MTRLETSDATNHLVRCDTYIDKLPKAGRRSRGAFDAVTPSRAVDGGHEGDKVNHAVGVAPLVVVPRYELDEGVGERDAGLLVKDAGGGIADHIARYHVILGVLDHPGAASIQSTSV